MRMLKRVQRAVVEKRGSTLVEAALAIPLTVVLFMGCVQFIQIGLAHLVVLDAAYEAGREAVMHQGQLGPAQSVAEEICRVVSPGSTLVRYDALTDRWIVTHRLKSIFPVLKKVTIEHGCPGFLFKTGGGPA